MVTKCSGSRVPPALARTVGLKKLVLGASSPPLMALEDGRPSQLSVLET